MSETVKDCVIADYLGKEVILTCERYPVPTRSRIERLSKSGRCVEIWGFANGSFWERVENVKVLDEID